MTKDRRRPIPPMPPGAGAGVDMQQTYAGMPRDMQDRLNQARSLAYPQTQEEQLTIDEAIEITIKTLKKHGVEEAELIIDTDFGEVSFKLPIS